MAKTLASLVVRIGADVTGVMSGLSTVSNEMRRFQRDFAGYSAAAGALTAATVALGKMADAGGQSLAIQQAFNARVSDTVGAIAQLRDATNGLVTDTELLRQTNTAFTLGSAQSVDEMALMARTAQILGRSLGVDAAFALNSLTTGIARQSRQILDNVGLIVSQEVANRNYADSLGVAVDSLTDLEKKEAFRMEAMRQATRLTQELGAVTLNAGDAYNQLGVEVANTASFFAQQTAQSGAVTEFFGALTAAVRLARGELSSYEEVMARVRANMNARATAAGHDLSFFPKGRAEDATSAMDEVMASVRAFGEEQDKVREKVLTFETSMATLEQRLISINEPVINPLTGKLLDFGDATRLVTAAMPGLHAGVVSVGDGSKVLQDGLRVNIDLMDKGQLGALALANGLNSAAAAQMSLNEAMKRGRSFLNGLSSLATVAGFAIPGFDKISGIISAGLGFGGAFGSGGGGRNLKSSKFSGFKAAGGPVPAGSWAIAGEAGPEIVTGPAHVTPMGMGGDVVLNVQLVTQDGRAAADTITVRQKRNEKLGRTIRVPLQAAVLA